MAFILLGFDELDFERLRGGVADADLGGDLAGGVAKSLRGGRVGVRQD